MARSVFGDLFGVVDTLLFFVMTAYEKHVYMPLQNCLSPLILRIPRDVSLAGRKKTFLTANRVTLGRTILVVPIAMCLKFNYPISACVIVALHDFLDHVDGIVAKVHRNVYGLVDSPILGSFLDAFCDKVVNVFTLWTILLLIEYEYYSIQQVIFVGLSSAVIVYEIVLGVVRVQDYFHAVYSKSKYRDEQVSIQASMEGKTKEKFESMALALFCLTLRYSNPTETWACTLGCLCLAVSVRFAHGSLLHKLKTRNTATDTQYRHIRWNVPTDQTGNGTLPQVASAPDLHLLRSHSDSESSNEDSKDNDSGMVDKVYTVGCFDLLHYGHEKLFKHMRTMGREVIVGVHNDESYFKLKKKKPIDNTERRMENVKKYADQVFAVSSTDPAPYIRCCVHLKPGETALYVRGDDMPQFPGRSMCEQLMSIQLLPYTQGVSSTAIRAQILAESSTSDKDTSTKTDVI